MARFFHAKFTHNSIYYPMKLTASKNISNSSQANTLITNMACIIVCALLIIYNKTAMNAAIKAFNIWLTSVMPALFPFFVCTSIMQKNGVFETSKSSPFASIFAVYFASAISGAPSGAKLMSQIKNRFDFDDSLVSILSALCNSVSPIFIVGSVAGTMLGSTQFALPIIIGHYLSSAVMLTAFLLMNRKKLKYSKPCNSPMRTKRFNLKILIDSILEGGVSLLKICGTIVFFMVSTEVIEQAGLFDLLLKPFSLIGLRIDFLKSCIVGMLEMANGCHSASQLKYVSSANLCALISFLLTFGGLCIMTQSMSFANIKPKKYILTKLLCAGLAYIIAYTAGLLIFPDSVTTSGILHSGLEQVKAYAQNLYTIIGIVFASLLGIWAVYLSCIIKSKRRLAQRL